MTATPILPSGVLPVATAIDLVQVSPVDSGQVRAVQDVIAASEDFAMLVDGFPPPPDEAEQLLAKIPPGSHPEDKAVMLVRLGSANIGVLDVVRDWPQRRTWMIGLLVLVPAARGRGVGGRVVATVDRWAIESGAKKLRVAVAPANVRGLRFWRRQGFSPVEVSRSGPHRLERPVIGF
ncbi:GNAT family N-acetyltransferase [Fodinicola acaciae]|uniref:GNAT family N-acetyltransferase n=1 Tax=Fodinicola acaciae TaxID=2681555 RepID=UPI0013D41438|nr:GNAT family N-acetyltransferase [Fodinicola acaciae]